MTDVPPTRGGDTATRRWFCWMILRGGGNRSEVRGGGGGEQEGDEEQMRVGVLGERKFI